MRLHQRSILFVLGGMLLGIAGTGLAQVILGSTIFPDVRHGIYYDEAIGELNQIGIIQGYENGYFGPDDFVTRGQVALLMKRLRDQLMNDLLPSQPLSQSQESSSLAASLTGGDTEDEEEETEQSDDQEEEQVETQTNTVGSIRFTIDAYKVDEDEGVARISVIRTSGNSGAATVEFGVSDGTAEAGNDYEVVSGTIRFSDRETSATFIVRILDDDLQEGNETINVT